MDTENQKKIWVAAFCVEISNSESSISDAVAFADVALGRYINRFSENKQESSKPVPPDAPTVAGVKIDRLTHDELMAIGSAYAKAHSEAADIQAKACFGAGKNTFK